MLSRRLTAFSAVLVFAVAFALGVVLLPTPAAAFCDLSTPQCPGLGCTEVRFECTCTNPGGQPRLRAILYCTEDPSIVIGSNCTNNPC